VQDSHFAVAYNLNVKDFLCLSQVLDFEHAHKSLLESENV